MNYKLCMYNKNYVGFKYFKPFNAFIVFCVKKKEKKKRSWNLVQNLYLKFILYFFLLNSKYYKIFLFIFNYTIKDKNCY